MMDHTMTKNPVSIPHFICPAEALRRAEKEAADSLGLTLFELMRRAGEAAFQLARSRYPDSQNWLILCGHGNNGGDGYVVARLAQAEGIEVTLLALESEVRGVDYINAEQRLRALILHFVQEYSQATHAHRVLTESVRYLEGEDKQRVLDKERALVAGFSEMLIEIRPDLEKAGLSKALTMLLFGMMNWMFTWLRSGGALDHEDMAPIVADLFLGGIGAVKTPISKAEKKLAQK